VARRCGEDGRLDASVDACWKRAKDGEVWEGGGMIDPDPLDMVGHSWLNHNMGGGAQRV
jgi:hypothetical protein